MAKENKSKYSLLGMLSLGPMSGYDLKKQIATSVGHFWNESYPQIYPILKQLAEEGLTSRVVEEQEGKPDRIVYSLTESGWEALRHWLAEPFEYQVERNELLLKLFFGGLVAPALSIAQIRRHRAMQVELLVLYEQTETHLKQALAGHLQQPYWLVTLNYGKHIARAMLAWCDETLDMLENREKGQ